MKLTISLPDKLIAELDELGSTNGRSKRDRTIQKLLRDSITREKQMRIAKLYCDGKKTLRQCAELLGVELWEFMDILYKLDIPLDAGGPPLNKPGQKLLRQRRSQLSS